ncbi:MAG: TldD/PmbA family protein [Candidatus Eisenbacteria bacterium]|uniref:TldD/PmbA family protein n=1 Tax=Eiseniibacteriota bacterium TaxID=2212470 RepID=A0A849SHB2_UNCEI|nr:TldD/PmbA family protein [Candidatus Eisenbacteria bacterium]
MSTTATPALSRDQLEALAARVLDAARRMGADHADSVVESSRNFSVQVNDGTIETLKQSVTHGLGLRVFVNDAVGVVSTNDLRPDRLEELARRAVALARLSTPDPANGMPTATEADTGADLDRATEATLGLMDTALLEWPTDAKIALAIELERAARGHDPRITRCDHVGVGTWDGAWVLASSHGLVRHERGTMASLGVVALADDGGGKQQSGSDGVRKRSLAELPAVEVLGRRAAARAVARIGARPVPTARVPVIMHPDIGAAWLSELSGAFSGEEVMKKSSWLTERLGVPIASPLVTLVDDGRLVGGVGTSRFDGEGFRTRRNVLIERGRCAMFVYDHYHARRCETRSTANATRSYGSVPGIGFNNLYIEAGSSTPEAILAGVERGFYMDDQGSYGFNAVTGDYSFQAQGFWVENGAKQFPVEGVTVASTSLEMLRNVVAVGDDLVFDGSIACPTLLIGEMTVSGK